MLVGAVQALAGALLSAPLHAFGAEYTCSFARGTEAVLEKASWGAYKPAVLESPLMFTFTFHSSADLKSYLATAKQKKNAAAIENLTKVLETSRATGYAGLVIGADGFTWPVIAAKGVRTVTFIEVTETGNVMATTAFIEERTVDGRIPAVHSRHTSVPGGAIPSQYSGACVAK